MESVQVARSTRVPVPNFLICLHQNIRFQLLDPRGVCRAFGNSVSRKAARNRLHIDRVSTMKFERRVRNLPADGECGNAHTERKYEIHHLYIFRLSLAPTACDSWCN